MQHEAFRRLAEVEHLNPLLVVLGSQSHRNQRLGFAAGKQGRTVGARQHSHFNVDIADFVESAPVGTPAVLEHFVAEDPFLEGFEQLSGHVFVLFASQLDGLFLQIVNAVVAIELAVLLGIQAVLHIVPESRFQLRVNLFVLYGGLVCALGLAGQLLQF